MCFCCTVTGQEQTVLIWAKLLMRSSLAVNERRRQYFGKLDIA